MITDNYDEIVAKEETIKKLMLAHAKERDRANKAESKINKFKDRALQSESEVKPLRDSINALSAEKSSLLRKLKRMDNKK